MILPERFDPEKYAEFYDNAIAWSYHQNEVCNRLVLNFTEEMQKKLNRDSPEFTVLEWREHENTKLYEVRCLGDRFVDSMYKCLLVLPDENGNPLAFATG